MDSDEELVARLKGGDVGAFDVLYERHEPRLFAYVRSVTGDRHDAEEVLHDAFLAALEGDLEIQEGGFRAWLYRVARNKALNRRRSEGRRENAHASVPPPPLEATHRADAALEDHELRAALEDAVRRLPGPLGEVYHLRTSGLSYEQIASVVDAPIGTVKSRMNQMVRVLREELRPWIAPT